MELAESLPLQREIVKSFRLRLQSAHADNRYLANPLSARGRLVHTPSSGGGYRLLSLAPSATPMWGEVVDPAWGAASLPSKGSGAIPPVKHSPKAAYYFGNFYVMMLVPKVRQRA